MERYINKSTLYTLDKDTCPRRRLLRKGQGICQDKGLRSTSILKDLNRGRLGKVTISDKNVSLISITASVSDVLAKIGFSFGIEDCGFNL